MIRRKNHDALSFEIGEFHSRDSIETRSIFLLNSARFFFIPLHLTILDQADPRVKDFTPLNFSGMRRLLRAGCTRREIQSASSAWSHLLEAQSREALKRQVHRAGSPASVWKSLRERLLPSDAIHTELWEKKFLNCHMRKGSDPVDFFSESEGIMGILREIGITMDESSISLRLLQPD